MDVNIIQRGQTLSALVDGNWEPERSGNYTIDCSTGRDLANEVISITRDTRNPLVIGTAIRAMVESNRYEAVEIGFCSRLGVVLVGS